MSAVEEIVEDARLGLAEAGAALSELEEDTAPDQISAAEWALLGALRRVRKLKGRAEA